MIGPDQLPGRLWRFLRAVLGRRRFEADLDAEMKDHLERRAADLMREENLSRSQAERRARLEFGSVESTMAACRDARRLDLPDELTRNLRHTLRVFRRSPGLTVAIILTLGLGIGVNAAVFTLVDAGLLRPLPYPESNRLVVIETHSRSDSGESKARGQDGRTWQALSGKIDGLDLALMTPDASGVNAVVGGYVRYIAQQRVGAGFFRVVGISPSLGRGFTAAEDVPGGPAVAVLSHRLWQEAFAGGDVLGKRLQLRGEPYQVVGVMPEGFRTGGEVDVWTPLRPSTSGEGGGSNYVILGRLAAGASWQAVESRVRAVGESLLRETDVRGERWLGIEELQRSLGENVRDYLFVSWAMAWLVLLVSCLNVIGLLLAHAGRRSREIATRMALGGGRAVILRQLLTESLTLSLIGACAGFLAALAAVRWLSDLLSARLGLWQPVQVDARVLALCAALAVVAVVVSGFLPAWQATRLDLRAAQASSSRSVTGGSESFARRGLLVVQMAVVVSLLVGAALLVRTVDHLQSLEPGFKPEGLLAATVSLQDARYEDAARAAAMLEGVADRLRRQPGVESVAAGLSLPYERPLNMPFLLAGESERRITNMAYVTPGYFETLGIGLIRGRLLGYGDVAGSMPVAVVNHDFVRTYLENRQAIGAEIRLLDVDYRIVGVVADTQQRPGWGLGEPLGSRAAVYVPVAQVPGELMALVHRWFRPSWVVRAPALAEAPERIRSAVAAVDPLLPVANFRSLRHVRDQALASQRIQAGMVSGGAVLALVLAAMGLAGLIASFVTERRRELGLRMALGATPGGTFLAALRPGLRLALLGLALGLPLSIATARSLRSFLYGVSAFDPTTYVAVAGLLLVVATVASVVPASRVLGLEPSRVLRQE